MLWLLSVMQEAMLSPREENKSSTVISEIDILIDGVVVHPELLT